MKKEGQAMPSKRGVCEVCGEERWLPVKGRCGKCYYAGRKAEYQGRRTEDRGQNDEPTVAEVILEAAQEMRGGGEARPPEVVLQNAVREEEPWECALCGRPMGEDGRRGTCDAEGQVDVEGDEQDLPMSAAVFVHFEDERDRLLYDALQAQAWRERRTVGAQVLAILQGHFVE